MRSKTRFLSLLLCILITLSSVATAQSVEELMQKGDDYRDAGDIPRAAAAYELAGSVAQGDEATLLHLVLSYQMLGDNEKAKALADSVLNNNPVSGEGYRARALLLEASGDAQGARDDMLRAEICGATFTQEEYALLGAVFAPAGLSEDAAHAFSLAGELAFQPPYDITYRAALSRLGRHAEAAELFGAPPHDERLKAAFDSGSFTLEKASPVDPKATYEAHIATSALTEYELKDDSIPHRLSEDGQTLIQNVSGSDFAGNVPFSFSPDGSTALYRIGSTLYALRGNIVTVFTPDTSRGVKDEYGNLEKLASKHTADLVSSEGVCWSPDGRYFVMTNWWRSVSRMNLDNDLVIFDVERASYYLADTHPNIMMKGGASVLQACFDPTGRYLFYLLFGNIDGYRRVVNRYEMETGEIVRVCTMKKALSIYPSMCRTPDGRFISLMETMRPTDATGINVLSLLEERKAWLLETVPYPDAQQCVYPTALTCSDISGLGLVLQAPWNNEGSMNRLLSRIDVNNGFSGLGEIVLIDSLDTRSARTAKLNELVDENGAITGDIGGFCLGARLSPDGRYAMLLMRFGDECVLRLMDIETLALRPVECDGEAIESTVHLISTHAPIFEWFANDLITLGEQGNESALYKLVY